MADTATTRDRVMAASSRAKREVMSAILAFAVQARRARGPLSVWLAKHPRSFYVILAIVWSMGWGFARAVGPLADEIYVRSSEVMQAVFFVGPAYLVWANLAPPPKRRVASVFSQAVAGFQRTATTTFWIAISIGVGYFVTREEGAGRSGLTALLVSTGGLIGAAALVRYVTMVRATMRSNSESRKAAEEVIAPGAGSPLKGFRSANVAWLTSHAWRMASTGFGATVVVVSLVLGIWAYVGIFTG